MTAPLDRIRTARRNPPPGPHGLVNFLAAFSVGLGLGEVLATGKLTTALGMRGSEGLVRIYGGRELAAGALTLAAPTAGIASRIVGDALDVATLVPPLGRDNPRRGNAAIALAAVLGVTALDILAFVRLRAA